MPINDEYIDFSLVDKDTQICQHVPETTRTPMCMALPTLKKTRLQRLSLSETTATAIQIIRRMRVKRLSEYFEQTCDRRQHATAVICGSSQLTYQELDLQANRLAHLLISRGIEKGDPVGVLLDRSLDTYIALLGVLKASAVFVPLDPLFPSNLVAFIAEDAGLRDIVTTSAFRKKTSVLSCSVLELDRMYEVLSLQPESRPDAHVHAASLCYIIYTFNTLGQPKGVVVTHANIVNFFQVVTPIYKVTSNDRVYQGMSTAFNFSFEEIWPAWIAGATLIAGPTDSQGSDHTLTEFFIKHKITVLCCEPALLAIIENDIPSLHTIFVTGQPCPTILINRWSRPGRRMFNTYGPAETTIIATICELFPGRPATISSPLPTYHIYILDDQLHPVQDGESGEICIGGPGVVMGYLNHPDFTKERFIQNPDWRDREIVPRLYRTGDIGRITISGDIEYLGRIDSQMKIHSYRIEGGNTEQVSLSEANTVPLIAIPQVHMAVLENLTSAPRVETGATSETKTFKKRMFSQLNLKNVYLHIMADPLYRNSIFNMASTFILGGSGFVFWIIIARLYKTENVGIATTLISILTLLSNFTLMGLDVSLNRYLPRSVNKNELINSSFVIVTIVTLLTSLIFLLGLPIFSPQLLFLRSNFFYIFTFTLFIIFCSWNTLVESIFMAFRAASNILLKNTIISIVKIVLLFVLIVFGSYGIFASTASAFSLGVLVSLILLGIKFKIKPSIAINIPLIQKTSMYSFANYLVNFVFNTPSLILPVIILNTLSAKYAAYFYVASMIQNMLLIIPLAIAQSLLTEGSYNEAEMKHHIKKAITVLLIILIPIASIIVLFGNILLEFFGKSYVNQAFQLLQLYSVSTIFTSFILISNAIMNIKHNIKTLVISNILASALTLWLSYLFTSNRLVGVGWGLILGQAAAGLVSVYFIIRQLNLSDDHRIYSTTIYRASSVEAARSEL